MSRTASLSRPAADSVTGLLYSFTFSLVCMACYPIAVCGAYLMGDLRARALLGYWPHGDHPPPTSVPVHLSPLPEWLEIAALLASELLLVGLCLLLLRRFVARRWWLTIAVALLPLGWC